MKLIFLILILLSAALIQAQDKRNRDDEKGDGDEDEGTVKSKPVVVRLPKNRLTPELHGLDSLREDIRAKIDGKAQSLDISPPVSSPPGPPPVRPLPPPPPPAAQVTPNPNLLKSQVLQRPRVQLQNQAQLQVPTQPQAPVPNQPSLPNQPLINSALANGASGLSGILANNPSLLKLLQGIGGPPGAGAPSPLSSALGQGGLLAPIQGAIPTLSQPPPFPGGGIGSGLPPGTDNGLLNVISSLGRQLGGAVGLNNIIPGAGGSGSPVGPSIPRISGLAGPPIAGIPNIPGLPVFPGAITPGGQLDVLQLVSAISRRALNGSSVTDVLPPNQIQKLADNLTNTLVPGTPDVDLNKYMGRWFEGINSPRATDQHCVVHHYGGLTENGKTATFTALKIYREASELGQVRYSIGYAFRGGRQEGMLQMHTSESTDPVPYWVYKLGPIGKDPFGNEQYEYAIVSNWIRYPVMVLVRDPDQFKRDHEESVLKWLEEKGFINGFVRAFNLVQPVSYQNCQYADSTFELFG